MFLPHLIKERKAKIRISGIDAEFETLMRANTVHLKLRAEIWKLTKTENKYDATSEMLFWKLIDEPDEILFTKDQIFVSTSEIISKESAFDYGKI